MTGQEHSFDSVMIGGRDGVALDQPLPAEPARRARAPVDPVVRAAAATIDDHDDIVSTAGRALHALGLRDGLSHMEWFRRPDGRHRHLRGRGPTPGSQFMTLMSYAHDTDLYAAWARLAVDGVFDPPQRSYACGGAYLRAQGSGRAIVAIEGLDQVSEETRSRVVEVSLPLARARTDGHVRRRRLRRRPRPRHGGGRGGAGRDHLHGSGGGRVKGSP